MPDSGLLCAQADALGFLHDALEVLLKHLQIETLILTGLISNSYITVRAHDANMRGFSPAPRHFWNTAALKLVKQRATPIRGLADP